MRIQARGHFQGLISGVDRGQHLLGRTDLVAHDVAVASLGPYKKVARHRQVGPGRLVGAVGAHDGLKLMLATRYLSERALVGYYGRVRKL